MIAPYPLGGACHPVAIVPGGLHLKLRVNFAETWSRGLLDGMWRRGFDFYQRVNVTSIFYRVPLYKEDYSEALFRNKLCQVDHLNPRVNS